jgi:hypothetical protein
MEEKPKNEIYRETAGGMPCKGYQEDGDSLLWAGLLHAADLDMTDCILKCEVEGQFFRSPIRAQRAKLGIEQKNSFSRDMSLGLILAAASDSLPMSVLDAAERWLDYVRSNKCKACQDDTDGRCIMTPTIFWLASYAGLGNVPFVYRATRWLVKPYLLLSAALNPKGYTLHLVAVSLFIMINYYEDVGGKIPLWLRLAMHILYYRQPRNAFFAWLAGDTEGAHEINNAVKLYLQNNGQGRMHQWAWERDDAEQAWRNSCGWDVEFIDALITMRSLNDTAPKHTINR